MKIVGILFLIIGAVDLIGSYAGFDLWGTLGVPLPEIIWKFSAYIELAIGFALFNFGGEDEDVEAG